MRGADEGAIGAAPHDPARGAPQRQALGDAMASLFRNLVSRGTDAAQDEWPDDLEAGGRVADHDDIRHVLQTCCDANAEALVLSFEDKSVCPARFIALGDDVFRLSLDGDLPPRLLPPTQCSVSLRFGQRNRVFIATVLSVRPGELSGGALELLLKMPGEIAAGEARMAFRVPILKPDDLALELRVNGAVVSGARPVNVSLIGMLIEVAGSAAIAPDAEVEVSLRRGEVVARLRAEIRRNDQGRLALFFPEALEDGSLEPPEELRTIARELELLWLRQRAR